MLRMKLFRLELLERHQYAEMVSRDLMPTIKTASQVVFHTAFDMPVEVHRRAREDVDRSQRNGTEFPV